MEKKGYTEALCMLRERFPDRITISAKEAALAMGVNIKAVYNAMDLVKKPLPYKKLGKKRVVIPITELARWMV